MSTGESDVARITSRAELQRILTTLAQRVDTLESELADERSRRRELEDLIERRDERYDLLLKDIIWLEDAVDQLRLPTVDTEPPENALPIMRLTWAHRGSPETLQANDRRAAVVWSHFFVCF